jgi:flagellar biosynthesis/type III secretory pathway M-ring protein FliF/YscJ
VLPPEPREPTPAMLLREEIASTVEQSPELAARLVRTWLKDA